MTIDKEVKKHESFMDTVNKLVKLRTDGSVVAVIADCHTLQHIANEGLFGDSISGDYVLKCLVIRYHRAYKEEEYKGGY